MATALLQLSDLHIGRDPSRGRRAASLARRVAARWPGPERPVIILTGDVVDDGEEAQFREASEMVGHLRGAGFQVFCVPGNHDYGPDGCHADREGFDLFARYLVDPAAPVSFPRCVRVPGWALVGLDSMKAECGTWDGLLADGELGSAQLTELDRLLAELQHERAAGLRVAVCVHHHPFLFPDDSLARRAFERFSHCLKDGSRLMATLTGAVDALLFGHEHRHLDFAQSFRDANLPGHYAIPTILACGSSTASDAGPGWFIEPRVDGATVTSVEI